MRPTPAYWRFFFTCGFVVSLLTLPQAFLLRLCLALLVLPSLVYGEQLRNTRQQADASVGQAGDYQLPTFFGMRWLTTQDDSLSLTPEFTFLVSPALHLAPLAFKACAHSLLKPAAGVLCASYFSSRAPPPVSRALSHHQ